jgi:hypothetical protein
MREGAGMRYLIDGYNLLYAWGLFPRQPGRGRLERARLNLLDRLRFAGAGGDVTVVFDGLHAPPGAATAAEYHGLHVRFSKEETADDLIEDALRHAGDAPHVTVVSDDHRIRDAGRRRHCRVLRCLDYIESLQHPARAPAPRPPDESATKPEAPSADEVRRLLEAFGEADGQEP